MNKIVMNYGFEHQGNFAALPIHIINDVPCNYSFVNRLNDNVTYCSEIGELKEASMRAIGIPFEIVDIPTGSKKKMMTAIANAHSLYESKEPLSVIVLYRFEKTKHNDTIFYDGLNIKAKTSVPEDFAVFNRIPQKPFFPVPILEMFDGSAPEIISKL